ncbi:MAG: winged helix-turn-helix domain-containing protein [Gemmataceae bacterium]|nr:winged helix-turn-helix domain-containing protein [Gemmataceae bacterium]MDW8266114.1 helix-turn-helix domain-containing protein [Gemmataceae bacterium]
MPRSPSAFPTPPRAESVPAPSSGPGPKHSVPRGAPDSPRWTFLTNHSHVLILLARDPTMLLREVAARIGITERAVQRIVAELEKEGYIERRRVGRQNRYHIFPDKPLRHPIEAHRTIGDLLRLIWS